jgi:hypothetical protein
MGGPVVVEGWSHHRGVVGVADEPRLGRELVRRQGVGVAQPASGAMARTRPRRESARSASSVWGAGSGDHLPSSLRRRSRTCAVLCVIVGKPRWRVSRGGERCRLRRSARQWRGRGGGAWQPRGSRCRRRPGPGPGGAAGGPGGGGLLDHSWAMIASNSARSSSTSAHISSRNSSSTPRTAPAWTAGTVGMSLTTRVRR